MIILAHDAYFINLNYDWKTLFQKHILGHACRPLLRRKTTALAHPIRSKVRLSGKHKDRSFNNQLDKRRFSENSEILVSDFNLI